jgi:hypothetical protein
MMHFLVPLLLRSLVFATWGYLRVFKDLAQRHQDQVDSVEASLQSESSILSQCALTILGLELCLGHDPRSASVDPPLLHIPLSGGPIFSLF